MESAARRELLKDAVVWRGYRVVGGEETYLCKCGVEGSRSWFYCCHHKCRHITDLRQLKRPRVNALRCFTVCQPYELICSSLILIRLSTDIALALPLPRRRRWSRRLRGCRVRWRLWRKTCHPRQRLLHGRLSRRQGTRRISLPLQQTSFSHQLWRQSGLWTRRRSLWMRRRYL